MDITAANETSLTKVTEKAEGYPKGGTRFDLLFSVLSLWIVAGLYLDGFAHHHIPELIETFFTPWHAVLYSGFAASAGLLLITQWRNVSKGYRWKYALPKGYFLSLLGSTVFLFSGGADFLWHEAFGFEVGFEALVSPSHLALAVGGVLMVSGPLRAAIDRTADYVLKGWGELLPAVLSVFGILAVLTFFMGEFTLISYPNLAVNASGMENSFFYDTHALAGVLIPTAFLMSTILFAIRNWTLPVGTLAILIIGSNVLMAWVHLKETYQYPQVLMAVVVAGAAAEVTYGLFRPSAIRIRAMRLFAFSTPVMLFALFFAVLINTTGIWWSVHMWTGAVFMAGVTGLLLSFLTHPFGALRSTPNRTDVM